MQTNLTKHARKRTKERIGLGKSASARNAQKAFDLGLKHSETKGRLFKYITALHFKSPNINTFRVYHRHVYLFADDRLVTVLSLPNNLCQLADICQKEKDAEQAKMGGKSSA